MQWLLAILLVAYLVTFAAPLSLDARSAPPSAATVLSRSNLRPGPGMTYAVVGVVVAGQRVQVAGMAVVRQRPQTAKGMVFVSLEDESGLLDLVIRPDVYLKVRTVLRDHPLLVVRGLVQRAGTAVSLLVQSVTRLVS